MTGQIGNFIPANTRLITSANSTPVSSTNLNIPESVQNVADHLHKQDLSESSSHSSEVFSTRKVSWLPKESGLPIELWFEIFKYLRKPTDLKNISRVCKELYDISRDKHFWDSELKLFGTLQDLNKEQLENQTLKDYRTLENAEKHILESLKPESKWPLLKTLLLFPSIREWILTKLPAIKDKISQTNIINALHPILGSENNPWKAIFPYEPLKSNTIEASVLWYLESILMELQDQCNRGLKNCDKAVSLGCPLNQFNRQETLELLCDITTDLKKEHVTTLPLAQKMPMPDFFKMRPYFNPLMIKAIESGNLTLVDALTQKKEALKQQVSFDDTPLWLAVKFKKPKIIRLLLEKGADPKLRKHWITLAAVAVENKDLDSLKLLVKEGDPDLNKIAHQFSGTLLHVAARDGSLDIVDYLCQLGADINVKNAESQTPLMKAILSKEMRVITYLLKQGAKIEKEELMLAAECGGATIFELLYESRKPAPLQNIDLKELLEKTLQSRQIDTLKFLLCKEEKSVKETDIMHRACILELPEAIQLLIDHGFDVNARTKYNESLLTTAVIHENIEIIKLLLKAGADLTDNALFVLTFAIILAPELVQDILSKLPQNSLVKDKALETAINANKLEMASILLKAGASFSLITIKMAIQKELFDILKIFIQRHGIDYEDKYGTLLLIAIQEGKEKVIKFLKAQGADINFKPTRKTYIRQYESPFRVLTEKVPSFTPLLTAIHEDMLPIVKWLVNNGADLVTPYRDITPLKFAQLHPQIAKFLTQEIEKKNKELI